MEEWIPETEGWTFVTTSSSSSSTKQYGKTMKAMLERVVVDRVDIVPTIAKMKAWRRPREIKFRCDVGRDRERDGVDEMIGRGSKTSPSSLTR